MSNGKINVQTENIFPIIKKFLYSDHDIFLRELVANAVDASRKLSTLSSLGEFQGEAGELSVLVKIDKEAKTLTISDRGVGMTAEEVEKYINQIAFSGAEEFVNKYKDQADGQLIGKFGLGFYSAFMVARQVELRTRSFKATADEAVLWTCDGSPEYSLTSIHKEDRGTDVILHLSDDSLEFLESIRIRTLLEKYCRYLPVEIRFEDQIINNTQPAWTKKPSELTHDDYLAFYRELYPMSGDPLFYIHLNVDYPFNLTGILYFPKLKKNLEVQKNKIKLFCRQVFVTDSVEGIVPDFLTLLHGVIDSPDIPLNVSRSYLQSDSNVKKISNHILKKVADKLDELFRENRTDFEAKWDDIGVFIKYGMLSEDKFYEKAASFYLLKNVSGKYFTGEEYKKLISANQEDKNKKLVYLYTTGPEEQHSFIEGAQNKGYDVLVFDQAIDPHFINFLEYKMENISFVRVDAAPADKLIEKEEAIVSLLNESEENEISDIAKSQLPADGYEITMAALTDKDAPVLITRPEFMRRMKEMSATGGGYEFMGAMNEQYQVVVNGNHPLMKRILLAGNREHQQGMMKQAIDLALLAQGLLKGEELTRFIRKSAELIN